MFTPAPQRNVAGHEHPHELRSPPRPHRGRRRRGAGGHDGAARARRRPRRDHAAGARARVSLPPDGCRRAVHDRPRAARRPGRDRRGLRRRARVGRAGGGRTLRAAGHHGRRRADGLRRARHRLRHPVAAGVRRRHHDRRPQSRRYPARARAGRRGGLHDEDRLCGAGAGVLAAAALRAGAAHRASCLRHERRRRHLDRQPRRARRWRCSAPASPTSCPGFCTTPGSPFAARPSRSSPTAS
jgi:hypothetical protein